MAQDPYRDGTNKPNSELTYKFSSIIDFYTHCNRVQDTGSPEEYAKHIKKDDEDFRGLSLEKILDSKYQYREGLILLKKLKKLTLNTGSQKYITKWSDLDGDEMSFERYIDEKPFLSTQVKVLGNKKKGKFISLYINIAELCNVEYKEMIWKTLAATKIIESLELQGYRVKVIAFMNVTGVGLYYDTYVSKLNIEVIIKREGDPLNLPLILTTTSPWFFRYWCFSFFYATLNTYSGLGRTLDINKKTTKENIYINTQECLNEKNYFKKLKELEDLGIKI